MESMYLFGSMGGNVTKVRWTCQQHWASNVYCIEAAAEILKGWREA